MTCCLCMDPLLESDARTYTDDGGCEWRMCPKCWELICDENTPATGKEE